MKDLVNRNAIIAVAASLALVAAPALADGKGHGDWDDHGQGPHLGHMLKALKAFGEELGLSDAQKASIKEKVVSMKAEIEPLREEAQALHKELFALLSAKKLDKAKVKAKHAEIQAVYQKIADKHLDTALEALELLTADQRTKLFERIEECKGAMCEGDCPCPEKGKGKEKGKEKGKGPAF